MERWQESDKVLAHSLELFAHLLHQSASTSVVERRRHGDNAVLSALHVMEEAHNEAHPLQNIIKTVESLSPKAAPLVRRKFAEAFTVVAFAADPGPKPPRR